MNIERAIDFIRFNTSNILDDALSCYENEDETQTRLDPEHFPAVIFAFDSSMPITGYAKKYVFESVYDRWGKDNLYGIYSFEDNSNNPEFDGVVGVTTTIRIHAKSLYKLKKSGKIYVDNAIVVEDTLVYLKMLRSKLENGVIEVNNYIKELESKTISDM
jgi:hypothetical protein